MLLKDARLRAFHTVALHGSFTKAAKHLLLSQQAVSFQIKGLEEEIGARLFLREQTGIELTETGELLYRYAEKILLLYTEAEDELAEMTGAMRGRLRIAATNSLVKYGLPSAIGKFRSLFPDVQVTIEVGNTSYCIDCLSKNLADVAFISEGPPLDGFHVKRFFRDEIALIVSPDDPYAARGEITLHELRKAPFVAREEGSGTRALLERLLGNLGVHFDELNIVLILGSAEAVKAAVEAGAGIGAVSRLSLRHELRAGTLTTVKLSEAELARDFYVVQRTQNSRGRLAARFLLLAEQNIEGSAGLVMPSALAGKAY